MDKEKWYILRTYKDQEYEAADLLEQAIPKSLCSLCRIPLKMDMLRRSAIFLIIPDNLLQNLSASFVYSIFVLSTATTAGTLQNVLFHSFVKVEL